MRRLLLGLTVASVLAGTAAADIAPPKTKPTSTKPKLESESVPSAFGGTTVFAGMALSLAVVSGGLFLARKRFPRTTVEV